jgi:hypothetical protein
LLTFGSMVHDAIQRLDYLCRIIPPLLQQVDEPAFSLSPAPGKWSKKQIMGHLIDSAANNHQRFVRAQFEDVPKITYNQDQWNAFNFYVSIPLKQILGMWEIYNLQLLELIKHIPSENLQRTCDTGGPTPHTLDFLIRDYVEHLEHHLREVVHYS